MILQLEGTEIFFDSRTGERLQIHFITRKQAEERGLIEKVRTKDEILYDQLMCFTPDQLREEMFLAGTHSVEGKHINRIGQQVLAAKCAAEANNDYEMGLEKAAAGNIDGSEIPPAVAQPSGVFESQVFGDAARAALEHKDAK